MRAAHKALGGVLLAAALAGLAARGVAQNAAGKVGLQTMTYEELGKLVRAQKGKVVVVDFWADT